MTRFLPLLACALAFAVYAVAPAPADWRWDVVIGTVGTFGGLISFVKAVRG